MIDVDYNEYKKTIEENMNLITENHKLKEEIDRLKNAINKTIKYVEWLRKEHHQTENTGYTKVVYSTNELLAISHKLKGEE